MLMDQVQQCCVEIIGDSREPSGFLLHETGRTFPLDPLNWPVGDDPLWITTAILPHSKRSKVSDIISPAPFDFR